MVGRSSFMLYRNGSENIGYNASAMIGNLCVGVFLMGVLIFTIIAATIKSGINEGLVSVSPNNNYSKAEIATAFTDMSDVESAIIAQIKGRTEAVLEADECRPDEPIDCRDLQVFHSLMSAAIDNFKDIHFYRFGKPVRGDNESCCHMAWRFSLKNGKKNKKDTFYKDYRSFRVVRYENCTLSVVGIGEYHSGGNARVRRGKAKGKGKGKGLEVGEDAVIPMVESESSFRNGKYLVYSGGGERCKNMNHYLRSLSCMLGEAKYLNRTLVMDLSICLSKIYSSSGVDEEGKDFRFYFDLENLRDDNATIVEENQFWLQWRKWQQKNGLRLHLVEDMKISPMKLGHVKDSLIMRKFGSVEPENYWYQVCKGEAESVTRWPWQMIQRSRQLVEVASAIAASMEGDFDAILVEKGEASSLNKIQFKRGRNLYIAGAANNSSLSKLKDRYSTHFLDDYKHLWDANSEWYDETTNLNKGNSVEFDGYMRISVDTEVFFMAKNRIII